MKVRFSLDYYIRLLCSFLATSGVFVFFVEFIGQADMIPWTLTTVTCAMAVLLWGISLRFPVLQVISLLGIVALAAHICIFQQDSLGLLFDAFQYFDQDSFSHLDSIFILEFLLFLLLMLTYITVSSACVLQSGTGVFLPQLFLLLFAKICSENLFDSLLTMPFVFSLLPSCIGCALLFSLTSRKKLRKKYSPPLHTKGYWQTLLLLVPPLLLSFILLPICTANLQGNTFASPELINTVNILAGKLHLPIMDASSLDSFNLSKFGLYPLKTRLGGTPRQNESIIMSVESDHNLLLRAATYDQYEGQYWNSHNSYGIGYFSPDSFLSDSGDIFDTDRPDSSMIPSNLYNAVFDEEEATVLYRYDIGDIIFTPGHLLQISGVGDVSASISGTLNAVDGLSSGDSYTLVFEQFRTYSPTYTEDILALEEYILTHPSVQDSENKMSEIEKKYLDTDVPDSVIEYAESLTTEDATPLEKVFDIQNVLATEYTYTLTVSNPASNADFVSNFIDTKEGYCTYFASAMTIFARINGIPARYVEGFSVDASDDSSFVLGTDAHAWCEVYIDGIGWVPIDATAASFSDTQSQTQPQQDTTTPTSSPTPVAAQITEIPVTATSQPQPSLSPTAAPSITSRDRTPSPTVIAVENEEADTGSSHYYMGLPILLLLLVPCLLIIREFRRLSLAKARHHIDNNEYNKALHTLIQNVLQNLALLSIHLDMADTLADYSSRLLHEKRRTYRRADHVTDLDMRLLVTLYEMTSYARHELTKQELEDAYTQAARIRTEVEATYKTHMHFLLSLLRHSLDKKIRFL